MDRVDSFDGDLSKMTKEELISHIHKLENTHRDPPLKSRAKLMRRRDRISEISETRHVALLVMYFGWNYGGMAKLGLNEGDLSVEYQIILALDKLGLANMDCILQRCGRTDKGVSAISQVVSLKLKSNLNYNKEFNYTTMLNSVLPTDIRILAWSPVSETFNARFSCKSRTYVYYFPPNGFNIQNMNKAAQYLIGTHNFSNFCCKSEIQTTVRTVLEAEVSIQESLAQFKVKATGFLYHQVRMFIHCLLLIGKGLEDIDLIQRLLNTELIPERPTYGPAPAFPLVFFDASYPEDELNWNYDSYALERSYSLLYKERIQLETKTQVIKLAEQTIKQRICDSKVIEDLSISKLFLNKSGNNYKNVIK